MLEKKKDPLFSFNFGKVSFYHGNKYLLGTIFVKLWCSYAMSTCCVDYSIKRRAASTTSVKLGDL